MNDHYEKEVSFIIATHNRCAVTLRTLERVAACGLDRGDFEIIVVDNASTDGTPEAVSPKCDRLIRLSRNAGSCAKAYGVDGRHGGCAHLSWRQAPAGAIVTSPGREPWDRRPAFGQQPRQGRQTKGKRNRSVAPAGASRVGGRPGPGAYAPGYWTAAPFGAKGKNESLCKDESPCCANEDGDTRHGPRCGYYGDDGGHGPPYSNGASGRYIVFLDDDSYPQPGSIARMIGHFEDDPQLGAAGFVVHLPDGRKEGGALPDVFLGCGVGFRAAALRESGGLDETLFMQAEEYDLSFRMAQTGWRVRMFDDLHVEHLKTLHARKSERTTYYDIRNNLRVAARYLPAPYYRVYRTDWLQRYRWLAERDDRLDRQADGKAALRSPGRSHRELESRSPSRRWSNGHPRSHSQHHRCNRRGARAGRWRAALERWTYRRWRLDPDVIERFFRWEYVRRNMAGLADAGVGCIVLADLGKNVYAYFRGARAVGITILAIGDDRFAAPGRRYRGLPIVPLEDALGLDCEAVVVGNSSPVHGSDTYRRVVALASLPVHHWFQTPQPEERPEFNASSAPNSADKSSRVSAAHPA